MTTPSTPTRRRVASKKYMPSPDDSASPLRPTTKANRMQANDDAAERAARRKSAHFAIATTGKENNASPGEARKGSALAVQGQRKAKRLSAVASAPPVSLEVMNTNFEEWMKLATDNKITSTNTWNFALIDYFHDLTLLRNGPDDQSINFQKASCTLDGCVKIWTSRVDSIATETGKLLSGLAGGSGGGEEEEAEDDEDGGEPKARKTHRSEATLAKAFTALRVKKLDLEFTVDPLFKKTSADFDEGGAMGLLMNHLGIDGTGRVVFDASDATKTEEDEEEEPEAEEELVDISALREAIPSAEKAAELTISETLGGFQFTSDGVDMPDFAALTGLSSFNDDEPEREASVPLGTGAEVDFFGGEDYDVGGGGGGFDDGASVGGDDFGDDVFAAGPSGGALGMAQPGDGHGPFDPRRGPGSELVMAFVNGEDDNDMFGYFDQGFSKQWAGAEHWKLRKVSRKDPVQGAAREKRAAKEPFKIDFMSEDAAQETRKLFAQGTRASTQLPARSRTSKRSAAAKRRDEFLLPDDMHFDSRQLLRLFLKPKYALRMRRSTTARAEADGEIDENFWAQAAADRVEGEEESPLPFESQFFHDDGDAGDFGGDDEVYVESTLADEEDLLNAPGTELRRARPENVHYAKKAKRVDVKRLKDDIWSGLRDLVDDEAEATESAASEPEADIQTPKAEKAPKSFNTVIQSLRETYPREKMGEISTSFCFICLLHLANEEGLRLETARSDDVTGDVGMKGYVEELGTQTEGLATGERTDRIVGELQALKVYKDPTAGRAA